VFRRAGFKLDRWLWASLTFLLGAGAVLLAIEMTTWFMGILGEIS